MHSPLLPPLSPSLQLSVSATLPPPPNAVHARRAVPLCREAVSTQANARPPLRASPLSPFPPPPSPISHVRPSLLPPPLPSLSFRVHTSFCISSPCRASALSLSLSSSDASASARPAVGAAAAQGLSTGAGSGGIDWSSCGRDEASVAAAAAAAVVATATALAASRACDLAAWMASGAGSFAVGGACAAMGVAMGALRGTSGRT